MPALIGSVFAAIYSAHKCSQSTAIEGSDSAAVGRAQFYSVPPAHVSAFTPTQCPAV
jgi:hypothetical protein